jgi:hypothetical protein
MFAIIVNRKGTKQESVRRRKMNMLKEKLSKETLLKVAIKMVRLSFVHWLLLMKPMLGMWTLEHLCTCRITKNGLKLMRTSHQ